MADSEWEILRTADPTRLADTTLNTGNINSVEIPAEDVARETKTLEERILQNTSARSAAGSTASVRDQIRQILPLVFRLYRVQMVFEFAQRERRSAAARLHDLQRTLRLQTANTMGVKTALSILQCGQMGSYIPLSVSNQIDEGYPRIDPDDNYSDIYEIVAQNEALNVLDRIITSWRHAKLDIERTLQQRAYRRQNSMFGVTDFKTGTYGIGASFVVLAEGAPDGQLYAMRVGLDPITRSPAVLAVVGGYRPSIYDFDRPSRYILPVSRDKVDTVLDGIPTIRTPAAQQSPNDIRRSFPPEIMLTAFPTDTKYAAFIHWMDHVATPEIRARPERVRRIDPPGGLELFHEWYIRRTAAESLENAAALATPSHRGYRELDGGARALLPPQSALEKWNRVRARTLFAHVK